MVVEGGRERMLGDRFCVRISAASGRSVRRIWWGFERVCKRVTPTIPQPAPSSRMLRPGDESVVSSKGRRGKVF